MTKFDRLIFRYDKYIIKLSITKSVALNFIFNMTISNN